jgi:hypothetical protein
MLADIQAAHWPAHLQSLPTHHCAPPAAKTRRPPLPPSRPCRNGRIVGIPSGDLLFFALGTGEYSELACEQCCCSQPRSLSS